MNWKIKFVKIIAMAAIGLTSLLAFFGLFEGKIYSKPSIEDTIVYADYYPWYNYASWKRGYSNTPYYRLVDYLT